MSCALCDALRQAHRAEHANFIAWFEESGVFLGDNQGPRGWCVLVLREHAEHLDLLPRARQSALFDEVARVAGAVRRVFATTGAGGGPPRINYECLGNQVAHVHWHVIPRHADDPDPRAAVWGWDAGRLKGDMNADARARLIGRLRAELA